jgi:hypothetical protein
VRPGEQLIAGVPRAQTNAMLAEGITAINNGLAAWWYEGCSQGKSKTRHQWIME